MYTYNNLINILYHHLLIVGNRMFIVY